MRKDIFKHGLAWILLYLFWVMVFQKRTLALSQTATVEFCYLLFIAANYYLNIYFSVPRLLYRKRYTAFAGVFLAGVVLTALLRVPLARFLNKQYFLRGQPQPGFEKIFLDSLFNIFIWTLVIVAVKLLIDRFHFQQYIEEVNKQKEQAELDFLNAQLNPHFLFNSLNAIYGSIDKQNQAARQMLLTFSDMLRYQLYDCSSRLIAIEKELAYVSNYIALQKERKEGLQIEVSIDENVAHFQIAPLLFIAFVENAFKYVAPDPVHGYKLVLSFKKQEDSLLFYCFNTKGAAHENSMDHKGIGMVNARRRLTLLYPGKHRLDINNAAGFFEVHLNITVA